MKTQLKYILFLILFFSLNLSYAQKKDVKHKEKTGVTAKYDMAGPVCNGIMRVLLNHKWGFIDTTGNVIVPPKYNEVTNFSEGVARVRNGRKWGLIDTKGTILIKVECDFIGDFADGTAKVMIGGQTYYTDTKGVRVK